MLIYIVIRIGQISQNLPNILLFKMISRMVLGLLDQLQIFRQLYLIELLGLLTGLGPLEL